MEILGFEGNIAEVEVNGTSYSVEVDRKLKQSKTPVLVRKDLPPPSRRESKIMKSIGSQLAVKAPLPGNIMQVFVSEGDKVKKGQKLLSYEAMKMENEMRSEKDGQVDKVRVRRGDSVLEGDILIELI